MSALGAIVPPTAPPSPSPIPSMPPPPDLSDMLERAWAYNPRLTALIVVGGLAVLVISAIAAGYEERKKRQTRELHKLQLRQLKGTGSGNTSSPGPPILGYRRQWVPLEVGGVALSIAIALHYVWTWMGSPRLWLLFLLIGPACAGAMYRWWAKPPRKGQWPSQRIYALTSWLGGTAWLALIWVWGPLLVLLGVAGTHLLLIEIPWWLHHRTRSKRVGGEKETLAAKVIETAWKVVPEYMRPDYDQTRRRDLREYDGPDGAREWAKDTNGTSAAGSRVMQIMDGSNGGRLKVGGISAQNLVAAADSLEVRMGTRVGGIAVEPIPEFANQCWLAVTHEDPLKEILSCPSPSGPSIMAPIRLGRSDDGAEVTVVLVPKPGDALFGLLAGVKGAGKSGVIHVVMRHLVECLDALVWFIDLKDGMEVAFWEGCVDRTATTVDGALEMIEALERIMAARGNYLARTRQRKWVPTPESPQIVVIVDEFHMLAGHLARLFLIATQARAKGISILLATQEPTDDVMGKGGTALRSQLDLIIGLRVARQGAEARFFGDGMVKLGWRTSTFVEPGCFLISSPEHRVPRPSRAYFLDDDEILAIAAAWAGKQPPLDTISAVAAKGLRAEPPTGAVREGRTVTLEEMAEEIGKSEATARRRLDEMVAAGKARKRGVGEWEIFQDIAS